MTSISRFADNDIIDLGRYVKFLNRYRKTIITMTIIGLVLGSIGIVANNELRPNYVSETSLLLTGPKYKIQLDDKLLTNDKLTDVQAVIRARETEYTAIARGLDVRRATAQRLRGQQTPEEIATGLLPADVSARASGSIVTLMAKSRTPDAVQPVAGAYAEAVSAKLDEVYGQSEIDLSNIQQQLRASMGREQDATRQLASNTLSSQLQELQTQLVQKQGLRDTLINGVNTSLANDLQSKAVALSSLDQFSQDAASLHDSIANGSSSSAARIAQANSLYVLQTKFATLNSTLSQSPPPVQTLTFPKEPTPVPSNIPSGQDRSVPDRSISTPAVSSQIRLQAETLLGGTSQAQLVLDVEALRQTIEQRRSTLAEAIRQSNELLMKQVKEGKSISGDLNGTSNLIVALNQDIQILLSSIQDEKQRILTLQRDQQIASTTTETLSKKAAEISIDAGLTGGKAIIISGASNATRVDAPIPPFAIGGSILGFIAGVAFALYRHRRRTTTGESQLTRVAVVSA